MMPLTDQQLDSLTLAEGAVTLNHAIDASIDVHQVKASLDRLADEAEHQLGAEPDMALRLEGLCRLFYHQWQFKGDIEQYFSSDNVFLDKVLARKTGIPASLGAVFLYLCERLSLPVKPIAFPSQLVLRIDELDEAPVFINPFNGERVSQRILRGWLKGSQGPLAELEDSHLLPSDNPTIIGRWLTVAKSALLREEKYALALRCSELALTFSPDDPYEIRDRGYIFQQLDCDRVAATDYEYFIEQCPDDPAAELLKMQVKALNEEQPTLH